MNTTRRAHPYARVAAPWLAGLSLLVGCPADDPPGTPTTTADSGDPTSTGSTSNGSSATPPETSAGTLDSSGDGGTCLPLGDACTEPAECCSSRCVGGACVEPGNCEGPGTPCTIDGECCSGSCQPVLGSENMVACTNYCFADGVACDKALDCCSLACNDGVCGGTLCSVESEDCTEDAQCCSDICNTEGQCEVDLGPGCRPVGEDCNSGGSTTCCSEVCNDQTDRCDFAEDVCHGLGATCVDDGDCCFGPCNQETGTCVADCLDDGQACGGNAECCSTTCTSGACEPPPGGCTPTGVMCSTNADCCTATCVAGFCIDPIP
ncbi:MAG: hypothetical protein KDK70_02290 [Myxococcales bacterium]|nr:hypothetical protein [Myxococcales bacterium]